MNRNDYASKIARQVNGEVKVVTKNNGLIVRGICIRHEDETVYPTVYVDHMYDNGLSVDEASEKVLQIVEENRVKQKYDFSWIKDFEEVKPKIKVRLLNQLTEAEVWKPAGHGFDDLILVPYIEIENFEPQNNSFATVKVSDEMIKIWNTTSDEILRIAEENCRHDTVRKTMLETLLEMDVPEDIKEIMSSEYTSQIPMYVISNESKMFGAYAVIPMLDELKEMFPNGFAVMPSSIHEVIVVPITNNKDELDDMVNDVNHEQVEINDRLSDHAYIFN